MTALIVTSIFWSLAQTPTILTRTTKKPPFQATSSNSHRCLDLLLSWKANYLHTKKGNKPLLHVAAMRGDECTLNILAAANLKGLDPNAKRTLKKRRLDSILHLDRALETIMAFERLICRLTKATRKPVEYPGDKSSDDDEFVDALESMEETFSLLQDMPIH